MSLQIVRIINYPISSNCFLIFDKNINSNCLIIDPGSESNEILYQKLDELKLHPEYIILTHEHFDHCWGVNSLRENFSAIQLIGSAICSDSIQQKKKNMSLFYNQIGFEIDKADVVVPDFDYCFIWNKYKLKFISTKGHTTSSICIIIGNNLFTGDTLIKDLKTITKLPTGSKEELMKSISKFATWIGNGYKVYPGHGESFELDHYDIMKSI